IAFALAFAAVRLPALYPPITLFTGILYTIPSLALFAFLVPYTGLSVLTAEIGLVSYTLLILIRNIVSGIRSVPADVLEAARVTLLGDVARWFADPANWQGPHGIPVRVLEHIELSGLAVVVAVAIAMPDALYLGHVGRGGFIAINVANIGRALPSLALLAFGL